MVYPFVKRFEGSLKGLYRRTQRQSSVLLSLRTVVFYLVTQQRTLFNTKFIQINVKFLVQKQQNIINVAFDGMSFGGDAVQFQMLFDLLQADRVVLISSLLENVSNQERLVLLPLAFVTLFLLFLFFHLRHLLFRKGIYYFNLVPQELQNPLSSGSFLPHL